MTCSHVERHNNIDITAISVLQASLPTFSNLVTTVLSAYRPDDGCFDKAIVFRCLFCRADVTSIASWPNIEMVSLRRRAIKS